MHPMVQSMTSWQLLSWHSPQSVGQLEHVSYCSQSALPQTEQTPQSPAQDAQGSSAPQLPVGQAGPGPRPAGQVKPVSVVGSQRSSPHEGHASQSGAQERQSSSAWQKPSPQ